MRLRQVALVAGELDETASALTDVFGLGEPYRDPGVSAFGLANVVFPLGDHFLEVVSPVAEGTTAGRLLTRRGGDSGYMVILQVDDLAAERGRVEELGVRVAWEIDLGHAATVHLHPRDVGAAIVSFDHMDPPSTWEWAGPGWEQRRGQELVTGLRGVVVQADDPASMAERWSEVTGRALAYDGVHPSIALDSGQVSFVAADDGRGEGVRGVELATTCAGQILESARARGLAVDGDSLLLAGTWFKLVD